jgi:phosphonate degradation associated HDIG domain protein
MVDEIFELFRRRGDQAYFGEPVSQAEHALQCAHLARQANAPNSLVVSALLHDFGHLLHGLPETIADDGIDAHHEELASRRLRKCFGPEVTEPIRLHVAAKRYLCATDADYAARLSPASAQSLALQGGPMNAHEEAAFESNPYFEAGVQLRRWDDEAKVPGLRVPPLDSYRTLVEACVKNAV